MTNPFVPKTSFTFAEMQESVTNVVNAFTDAVDEHIDDEGIKMKIAISFAANVFKTTMRVALKKQKDAEQTTGASNEELDGLFKNDADYFKRFFDGL